MKFWIFYESTVIPRMMFSCKFYTVRKTGDEYPFVCGRAYSTILMLDLQLQFG